ncbi:hypothetical protein Tsubulata_003033 [Turnera subulata]|uniref:UBC core domain-containing protein n=1 Tax=Turnera subulata TaxID=218843 RepID=A0A9Q0G3Z1_9ROSI|nr:hypothetical protein Tsubulata_003033 [Turnera subulata]
MRILPSLMLWGPSESAPQAKVARPSPPLEKTKLASESDNDRVNYAKKRLLKELKDARADPPFHCSFGLAGDDIFKLQGAIIGPSGTPFEGGVFFLSLEFTEEYPSIPPKIKFLTKVFHPNIGKDGSVHVDILKKQWSPAMTTRTTLLSICSLLPDPDPVDPLSPICILYRNDRKAYYKKAREWTIKYAMS